MAYEIKKTAEDFIVEEITPDETILELGKKWKFKESKGDFLICVLEKKDWDTHIVMKEIAKKLRVSKKRISFAGTKDKRAWTTQRISIWRIPIEDFDELKIKDVKVSPLYYSDESLKLGDLTGNKFTIKVHSNKTPKKLKKFKNYFGEQRFGTKRPITHLVGEQIIKGNFEDAVKIYLAKVFNEEHEEAKNARIELSKNWDYKEALNYFPKSLKFERTMIAYLAEHPDNYIGALRTLPKFLKIMFTHAYQSFLFNEELKKSSKKEIEMKPFEVKQMPEMSTKNVIRKANIEINDLDIKELKDKEYLVKFSLPKGSYATTVIEKLFA